jgi:hypothetical protein
VNQPTPEALRVAESARTIDLQMLSERGRGAVLVGAARVDAALDVLLKASLAPPSGKDRWILPAMSRCFPSSVLQLGRDHLGWCLELPEGREQMSVDLELPAKLHRRIPPIDSSGSTVRLP